jgi:hypothetical protein
MYKDLKFRIGVGPDITNLLQGKFPGQHYPGNAVFGEKVYPLGRGDIHLGGSVDFKGGKIIPDHFDHPKILDDEPIGTYGGKVLEELVHTVRFPLFKDSIHRNVELPAHAVEGADSGLKLGPGEIGAPHPGVKTLEAQVNRIGSLGYGRVQSFRGTGGGQKFEVFHRKNPWKRKKFTINIIIHNKWGTDIVQDRHCLF